MKVFSSGKIKQDNIVNWGTFFTLSPYNWNGSNANVFRVGGSSNPGYLDNNGVHGTNVVRPVVSLKAEVVITGGDGSSSNPYTVTMP